MEFSELPGDETLDGRPLAGAVELPSDGTSTGHSSRGRLLAFGVIAMAAVTVFGVGLMPSKSSAAVKVSDIKLTVDPVGQVAPDFTANKLDGSGPLALSGLRGKVVVVNFWASWCTTCKTEAAVLGAGEKQWRNKGVVFIGVDSRDTTVRARAFEQQYGISYDSVVDPNADIGQHYYVTGFPETYFIGRNGKVVEKFVSAIDAATLNQYVAAAIAAN